MSGVTLPGAGKIVATEVIGGQEFQRVKIVLGSTGEDDENVFTGNPMPVVDSHSGNLLGSILSMLMTSGNLLQRILSMLTAPLGYDKSLGRQRGTVLVESGTVTTVTTVTTVGNVAAVGGYPAQMQILDTNRAAWAQCVRARIT